MNSLNRIIRKINSFFWDQHSKSEFIGFFRITVGMVMLLHFVATIRDFNLFNSSKAIVPQDIMTTFDPSWLITMPGIVRFFEAYGVTELTFLNGVKIAFIGLCCLIIIGMYARLAAFFLLLLQISLVKGSSFFIYGVDFFSSMSLFYIILFPSDSFFSLKQLLSKQAPKEINFTPIKRLFQLHLSIAYFFSGFDKILGFNWRNGESIWKAIHLPYANRDFNFDFSWMAQHSYLLVIIAWMTIIIEMCYPIFIWIPQTRRLWLLLTVAMHLGIAVVLNLYYFSAIMIVWNLTNFYFEGIPEISSSRLNFKNISKLKVLPVIFKQLPEN